jgi:two-component system, cell cycle sensor histidine kinase and response regulator CckA
MSRVLIVEDNADNRNLLEAILSGAGHEVLLAENGAEALALARATPPDLVVSDILMPVMDGFALCREWRADQTLSSIPFMFYTATYTEPKDEAFALALGADRFVLKPQMPSSLVRVIAELLESRRAGGEGEVESPHPPAAPAVASELNFVREHRDAVIRKLEDKMHELEAANATLRREVAERSRAERAARAAERRFHSIFDNAIEGIFLVTLDGRFVAANPALARMLGYAAPEELLADGVEASHRWEAGGWDALLAEVRTAGEARGFECGVVRRGEERVCLSISARLVRDGGEAMLIEGVAEDVSERRRLERELLQAQKMEAVGRLAGGIAHDFNNLLQAMLSQVEAAGVRGSRGGAAAFPTEGLVELIRRGAALTRQLLLFSRREASSFRTLDLNDIVRDSTSLLQRLMRADIAFETALCDEELPVLADRGQVEQVLMNLAINAGDAMASGGRLAISTRREPDGSALLTVEDSGCGMSEAVREHIFEPFFTTKPAGEGTGLGLSVVHGIVTRHGGTIRVETAEGRGSSFSVTFPALRGEAQAAGVAGQGASVSGEPAPGTRVLVVEDEPGAREVLAEILASLGYEAVAVGSGTRARELPEEPPFALLLTDLALPDVPGIELSRELARRWPGLRVVLMSGFVEDETVRRLLASGAAHFLQKPFDIESLASVLRAALHG